MHLRSGMIVLPINKTKIIFRRSIVKRLTVINIVEAVSRSKAYLRIADLEINKDSKTSS